eukprot:CAMPEP_0195258706 /NCGR_PEP_ID=MMETSP0706-20130129/7547_1 /TAXON_ID=33640 /ORGANISM="Asterionellopsis glacialis, Strain CCMP134" /LENGTH=264 /DNA_ID=CAMNT_0040312103 /DNA_START=235 /DNA_END=1029 /DNA_ORIENTATION=+
MAKSPAMNDNVLTACSKKDRRFRKRGRGWSSVYVVMAAVSLLGGLDDCKSTMNTSFGITKVLATDPGQQQDASSKSYRGKNNKKHVRHRILQRKSASSHSDDGGFSVDTVDEAGDPTISAHEEESSSSSLQDATTTTLSLWDGFLSDYRPILLFQHICRKLSRHRDNPDEKNVGSDATPLGVYQARPKPNFNSNTPQAETHSSTSTDPINYEDFILGTMTGNTLQFSYLTSFSASGDEEEEDFIEFPQTGCAGDKECDRETRDV